MDLKKQIVASLESIIRSEGAEFLDMVIKGKPGSQILRFIVDHEKGVTLDECVRISRKISNFLEENENTINLRSYRLEVTSPGLDYPLKTVMDFKRNLNRKVNLHYLKDDQRKTIIGNVLEVNEESVCIEMNKTSEWIPLNKIENARIQLPW